MPYKCIYMHIHKEFMIRSCILAYKGNANVYESLWTPTCICAIWTYFLTILYDFSFLISSQKTLSSPILSTITWQTFPITTASHMTSPPYILLFTPYSTIICKDNFPLVYMYKSSRYYAVFHINLGPVLTSCATWPFGAQAHDVTVSRRPNSHDSATCTHWLHNGMPHTGSNLNKTLFWQSLPLKY